MSVSRFDAFWTPPGITLPERANVSAGPTSLLEVLPDESPGGDREGGTRVAFLDATPDWVDCLASALRSAGEMLRERGAADVLSALGRAGRRFRDAGDPLRRKAIELLPVTSGLSREMAAAVLDGMAADWTEERLGELVDAELGQADVLDGFVRLGRRETMAAGPALAVQVVAGGVPGVGVHAICRSLLVKGPTLLKPGRGDVVLPVLFARAVQDVDPALANALAVVYWPGGSRELEDAALAHADVVTAYASDETVAELRARAPVTARFVAYHHRVSIAVVGRNALTDEDAEDTAAAVARAIAIFDRRGCVSPLVVYVEEGGACSPRAFAEALAQALAWLEERLPSGRLDVAEASTLQQTRGTAELMSTSGSVHIVHGGAAPWTVLLERAPAPDLAVAGRFARVRPLSDVEELAEQLAPLAPHLQTVGVAGFGRRLEAVARAVGVLGASRIAPLDAVPFPPPWWHHDGRGPLLDLVRWVDLERD